MLIVCVLNEISCLWEDTKNHVWFMRHFKLPNMIWKKSFKHACLCCPAQTLGQIWSFPRPTHTSLVSSDPCSALEAPDQRTEIAPEWGLRLVLFEKENTSAWVPPASQKGKRKCSREGRWGSGLLMEQVSGGWSPAIFLSVLERWVKLPNSNCSSLLG